MSNGNKNNIFDLGYDRDISKLGVGDDFPLKNKITDSLSTSLLGSGEAVQNISIVDGYIQSNNYEADTDGWRLSPEEAEFNTNVSISGYVEVVGGEYKSSDAGARVELFPDSDTGLKVIDDDGNNVLEAMVGGVNVGDVTIGDYSGGQGLKYDKGTGTMYYRNLQWSEVTDDDGNRPQDNADVTDDQFTNSLWDIDDGTNRSLGGLDSNSRYINWLSTTNINESKTLSERGVVVDSDGIRGYNSYGTKTFEIDGDEGHAFFRGEIGASKITANLDLYDGNRIRFYTDGGYNETGVIYGSSSEGALYINSSDTILIDSGSGDQISFSVNGSLKGYIDSSDAFTANDDIDLSSNDLTSVGDLQGHSSSSSLEDSYGNRRTINDIVTSSGGGDNLGDHTATQDLDMSNYNIDNCDNIYAEDLYGSNGDRIADLSNGDFDMWTPIMLYQLSSAPSGAPDGTIYYDTSLDQIRGKAGGDWYTL